MKKIPLHSAHLNKSLKLGLLVLVLLSACSTQKNTFVSRNFHSITTKYNGFFNARESYREGVKRLAQEHEDNYEDVLSIFRYGSEQQMRSVAGNMEIAYQKELSTQELKGTTAIIRQLVKNPRRTAP